MNLLKIYIVLYITLAQQPCTSFLNDELGCISNAGQQCSWNQFTSSCQSSTSVNIGCNQTLNYNACIAQLIYPNEEWAYCRFSGYCRAVTENLDTCDINLSSPACLAVTTEKCKWESNLCKTITATEVTLLQSASSYSDDLKYASVLVCQGVTNFEVVHSWSARTSLQTLFSSTLSTNAVLAAQYKTQLNTPGCLVPDTSLLNLLTCDALGLNKLACMKITTSGQQCIFQSGKCQTLTNPSALSCSDSINKESCLSVTNINQPCYWQDGQCKFMQLSSSIACNTYSINNVAMEVSPSFCSANISYESGTTLAECFYNSKKRRCHSMCRAKTAKVDSKTCRQSSFGCEFKNSTCVFKNLTSQCGLLGQNKAACMNALENCQFKNGFCISISNLNSVGCSDGLNLKACISVTKKGQQCRFSNGVCGYYKSTYYDGCADLTDVNSNVCQRYSGSGCYWINGNCYSATNQACTQVGLNRQGCLYSLNTVSACQWIAASGSCQNLAVVVNVTQCDLKLINDLACRQIQLRDLAGKDIMCQYADSTNSCQVVTDVSTVTCGTTGLNRAGCVSIQSSDVACRWTQGQCVQVLTSLSNVSCSSLSGVTQRTCSLVTSNEEMCAYSSSGNRCTTSVQKNYAECNMPGVNGYGCSFLDNGKSCYFNDDTKVCTEITTSNQSLFQSLQCTSGQMNKKACLLISTPGQRCYWNDMKKQCQSYPYPTYEYCEWISNAGINTCVGYENDVQGYIDEESRCTVSATDPTQCALYSSTTTLVDCGGVGIKLNMHACVALSNENDYCYFNTSTYVCTLVSPTDLPKIISTISCKQAGKKICTSIQTPDQACAWDNDEQKCFYQDLCQTAADLAACLAINQPCVFKDSACSIISSTQALTYNCNDDAIKFNKLGCMTILGGTCKFTSDVCQQITVSATDLCNTYSGNATIKYNPLTCASITSDSEQCVFDRPTGGCLSQVAITDQCAKGQNKANCLSENGCDFTEDTKLCTSLPYDCGTATTLTTCKSKENPCMWVNADNKCKPSPYFENCTDYSTAGTSYNDYTCNSQYVSDPDNFICGAVLNAANDYVCQEVANKKCKGTDIEACRYIKNTCIFTSNTCKQTSITYKKCNEIFTKYACLSVNSLYCQWDDTQYCIDWDQATGECGTDEYTANADVSQQICYYMGCYFDINDLTCKTEDTIPLNCETSKGPSACAKVAKNCYWDNDNKCKELLDLTKAQSFTFNQVYYSNRLICLAPKSEGVLTIYDGGQCQSPDVNSISCNSDVNIRACEAIATQGQKCVYKSNQCQAAIPSTLNCTDSLNIHGCVSVSTAGQYCVWLGQQCAILSDDGYTMTKYDIVNQNACLKTYTINGQRNNALAEIGVKFSESVQTCVASDPDNDLCTTPGLNYYGCLQTKADICTWNGTNCVKFTQTGTYQQCSDYANVSAKVCESITIVGAKCYYFNYGCANATTTMKCTQSLNKEACIMQEQYSCKWVDGSCQEQSVLPAVTACSGNIHQLAQYSSPYSCQLVSFGLQACLFDKEGCTQKFDPLIHGCSTLGLNKDGCTQVTLEKCIFQDNKCQQYSGDESICRNLVNVNALVCASLDLADQPCKYSRISKGCVEAVINDTCQQEGINAAGCKLLPKCAWNYDTLQCQCTAFMDGRSFCKKMSSKECLSDDRCLWEDGINACRIKKCEDQDITQCSGWVINNYQCYIQNDIACVSAQTCNDVRGVSDCSKISVFQQQCYQHSSMQCQIRSCEVIIKETDCSGLCQWNGASCDYKKCEYFSSVKQCQGTYYNQSCQWINGKCVGFTSCQQYNNYDADEAINQSLCASAKVFGAQCRWQQDAPFSSTYDCSSNPCRPLGSSKVNCEGAETQDSVCVLNSDFTCVSCESITDGCECASYIGNCKYVGGSCISVACSSLSKSNCALFSSKCMWYEADQKCFVQCVKLKQSECESMQQYLLCYWDGKLEQCNAGVSTVVQIDTVAPILLPQAQSSSNIIMFLLILLIQI